MHSPQDGREPVGLLCASNNGLSQHNAKCVEDSDAHNNTTWLKAFIQGAQRLVRANQEPI